jgi:hypothetical protein
MKTLPIPPTDENGMAVRSLHPTKSVLAAAGKSVSERQIPEPEKLVVPWGVVVRPSHAAWATVDGIIPPNQPSALPTRAVSFGPVTVQFPPHQTVEWGVLLRGVPVFKKGDLVRYAEVQAEYDRLNQLEADYSVAAQNAANQKADHHLRSNPADVNPESLRVKLSADEARRLKRIVQGSIETFAMKSLYPTAIEIMSAMVPALEARLRQIQKDSRALAASVGVPYKVGDPELAACASVLRAQQILETQKAAKHSYGAQSPRNLLTGVVELPRPEVAGETI